MSTLRSYIEAFEPVETIRQWSARLYSAAELNTYITELHRFEKTPEWLGIMIFRYNDAAGSIDMQSGVISLADPNTVGPGSLYQLLCLAGPHHVTISLPNVPAWTFQDEAWFLAGASCETYEIVPGVPQFSAILSYCPASSTKGWESITEDLFGANAQPYFVGLSNAVVAGSMSLTYKDGFAGDEHNIRVGDTLTIRSDSRTITALDPETNTISVDSALTDHPDGSRFCINSPNMPASTLDCWYGVVMVAKSALLLNTSSIRRLRVYPNSNTGTTWHKPYYYIVSVAQQENKSLYPLGLTDQILAPDVDEHLPYLGFATGSNTPTEWTPAWRLLLGSTMSGKHLVAKFRHTPYPNYYRMQGYTLSAFASNVQTIHYHAVHFSTEGGATSPQDLHNRAVIVATREGDYYKADLQFTIPVHSGVVGQNEKLAYQINIAIYKEHPTANREQLIFNQTISAPILRYNYNPAIPNSYHYYRLPITDINGEATEPGSIENPIDRHGAFVEFNDTDINSHGLYGKVTNGAVHIKFSTFGNTIPSSKSITECAWLSGDALVHQPIEFPDIGSYRCEIRCKSYIINDSMLDNTPLISDETNTSGDRNNRICSTVAEWLSDVFLSSDPNYWLPVVKTTPPNPPQGSVPNFGQYVSGQPVTHLAGPLTMTEGVDFAAINDSIIEYRFTVTEGIQSTVWVHLPAAIPTQGIPAVTSLPTPVNWGVDSNSLLAIDYYHLEIHDSSGPISLGTIGTALFTNELSFLLRGPLTAGRTYTARLWAIPMDQTYALEAIESFKYTPSATLPPFNVTEFSLSYKRPNRQFAPIRLLCYNSKADVNADAPKFLNPVIEGQDKTDWSSFNPPVLSEYKGNLEFYYLDGKIYTNADLRSIANIVVLVYYRLYDAVSLHLDLTRNSQDVLLPGQQVYSYILACSPDVFKIPVSRAPAAMPLRRLTGEIGRRISQEERRSHQ